MTWQPIETAPKDGQPFLGLSGWSVATYCITERPDEVVERKFGIWPFRRTETEVKPGGLFLDNVADGGNVTLVMHGRHTVPVTHWMPLPEPPEQNKAGTGT